MAAVFNPYKNVFSPIKVGNAVLKNRIQFSPVVSAHATARDGDVTEELVEFLSMQARTGVSIVTIGSTPVDFDRSRDFVGAVSVCRDTDVPGLVKLSQVVHRYGAKLSVELCHAGPIADKGYLKGKKAFVPSVLPGMQDAEEISKEEMQKVKEAFVSCAVRVKNAGFDAVMIHCAHGVNLLSAFMSPIYNHRTDEYGGSLENRIRYPLEILKAVREAVGVSMIIECRVSGSERLSGCPSLEDTCAFLKRAQEYVDLVNVSGGALKSEAEAYSLPSYHMPHMLNVKYAGQIKKHIGIPVAVVGNITTMEEAEQILAEGKADVICMARNMLADPDFIKKAYRNQAESIRPCVRCFECGMAPAWGGIVRCAVNPQCGKEIKYGRIFRADEVKKVMIAGAGPAGMMAAQTCARRGHEVVLYEREEKLGGRLYEVSAMDCKDGYKRYVRWMIQETMSCGVKIVTGKEVTPQIVESENPDVLMIAVGADILTPPIEGIHLPNVVKVDDVDLNKAETGQKVVVCGAGLSGAECGVQLAKDGKQVTLIDFKSAEQLAFSGNFLVRAGLNILIKQYKVEEIYEAKIQKITEKGLYYKDQAGETKFLEADTIVSAFGMRSRTKTVDMLKELVPETYVIDDAEKVGNVMKANRQAFEISVEI